MGTERERKLAESIRAGSRKTEAARQRGHAKKTKTRPWKALADEWREEMWRVFGKGVVLTSWTVKEQQLCRKLLREVEYETAEKMVQAFIQSWDEPGLPAFPFLWIRRESVLATLKGQAQTRRSRIDVDEYNEERDGGQPKIGWE